MLSQIKKKVKEGKLYTNPYPYLIINNFLPKSKLKPLNPYGESKVKTEKPISTLE